ncbi:PASTA domain-containing protein [Streptomyces sp. Tu102]|uniref:PASTA domain-containing protein n=1 Tax=Streptomyces sp. Tu102 TaxID=2838019 RepID=UPI0027E3B616|nr:PASTA domain-containing protein [Streptomyces sp. Tu102]
MSSQTRQDTEATEAEPETATLPNLVGQDLQAAQDAAQAAGFYVLDDQDASGQNRLPVFDRNRTVCSQQPAAGTHPTDTAVTLYAVKDDETCLTALDGPAALPGGRAFACPEVTSSPSTKPNARSSTLSPWWGDPGSAGGGEPLSGVRGESPSPSCLAGESPPCSDQAPIPAMVEP